MPSVCVRFPKVGRGERLAHKRCKYEQISFISTHCWWINIFICYRFLERSLVHPSSPFPSAMLCIAQQGSPVFPWQRWIDLPTSHGGRLERQRHRRILLLNPHFRPTTLSSSPLRSFFKSFTVRLTSHSNCSSEYSLAVTESSEDVDGLCSLTVLNLVSNVSQRVSWASMIASLFSWNSRISLYTAWTTSNR